MVKDPKNKQRQSRIHNESVLLNCFKVILLLLRGELPKLIPLVVLVSEFR